MFHPTPSAWPWVVMWLLVLTAACDSKQDTTATDAGSLDAAAGSGGWGGGGTGGVASMGWGGASGLSDCPECFIYTVGAEPPHLTTHYDGAPPISVRIQTPQAPDQAVLDALQNATLRRVGDDSKVDVSTEWTTGPYGYAVYSKLAITPVAPLEDGWYRIEVEGALPDFTRLPELSEGRYGQAFRVGSAPLLKAVYVCSPDIGDRDAGDPSSHRVVMHFSEPVTVPDALPITWRTDGDAMPACTRIEDLTNPTTGIALLCEGAAPARHDFVFAEGIASPEGIALRNPSGETTFALSIDDTNTWSCDTWRPGEIPTF